MGAHFQAPHATPGQRQMETLSWVDKYKNNKEIICDSDIKIIWVQVSRLPMPHPDKDRWKCTMFTNNLYALSMLL